MKLQFAGHNVWRAEVPVLTDFDFTVEAGEVVAVVGANGSGKSSLFAALVGLLPAEQLTGRLQPGDYTFLPQRSQLNTALPQTVSDVLAQAQRLAKPGQEVSAQLRGELATLLRLDLLQERQLNELSGGERRRVLLARTLWAGGHVALLDEPDSELDIIGREALLEIFRLWAGDGRMVLFSTHDLNLAEHASKILFLRQRQLAFGTPAQVCNPTQLKQVFGNEIIHGEAHEGLVINQHHHH